MDLKGKKNTRRIETRKRLLEAEKIGPEGEFIRSKEERSWHLTKREKCAIIYTVNKIDKKEME